MPLLALLAIYLCGLLAYVLVDILLSLTYRLRGRKRGLRSLAQGQCSKYGDERAAIWRFPFWSECSQCRRAYCGECSKSLGDKRLCGECDTTRMLGARRNGAPPPPCSPASRDAAAHDLMRWLAEGPLPAREIKARAMKSGFGLPALSWAAKYLGVFEYTDAKDEIWWDAPTKSLSPTV